MGARKTPGSTSRLDSQNCGLPLDYLGAEPIVLWEVVDIEAETHLPDLLVAVEEVVEFSDDVVRTLRHGDDVQFRIDEPPPSGEPLEPTLRSTRAFLPMFRPSRITLCGVCR